jgi:hypothetical protein
MASGDLTASEPVYIDAGDATGIKAAIDNANLATATDCCFVIPVANGSQVCIFKVEREA